MLNAPGTWTPPTPPTRPPSVWQRLFLVRLQWIPQGRQAQIMVPAYVTGVLGVLGSSFMKMR